MELAVEVITRTDAKDHIGIDTSTATGITISAFGVISVGGSEIGEILDFGYGPSTLFVGFYENATPELVQKLVRALTYRHDGGALGQSLEVEITPTDIGGRHSKSTVMVEKDVPGHLRRSMAAPGTTRFRAAMATTTLRRQRLRFPGWRSRRRRHLGWRRQRRSLGR